MKIQSFNLFTLLLQHLNRQRKSKASRTSWSFSVMAGFVAFNLNELNDGLEDTQQLPIIEPQVDTKLDQDDEIESPEHIVQSPEDIPDLPSEIELGSEWDPDNSPESTQEVADEINEIVEEGQLPIEMEGEQVVAEELAQQEGADAGGGDLPPEEKFVEEDDDDDSGAGLWLALGLLLIGGGIAGGIAGSGSSGGGGGGPEEPPTEPPVEPPEPEPSPEDDLILAFRNGAELSGEEVLLLNPTSGPRELEIPTFLLTANDPEELSKLLDEVKNAIGRDGADVFLDVNGTPLDPSDDIVRFQVPNDVFDPKPADDEYSFEYSLDMSDPFAKVNIILHELSDQPFTESVELIGDEEINIIIAEYSYTGPMTVRDLMGDNQIFVGGIPGNDDNFNGNWIQNLLDIETGAGKDNIYVWNNIISNAGGPESIYKLKNSLEPVGNSEMFVDSGDGDDFIDVFMNTVYAGSGDFYAQPAQSQISFDDEDDISVAVYEPVYADALMDIKSEGGKDEIVIIDNDVIAENGNAEMNVDSGGDADEVLIEGNTIIADSTGQSPGNDGYFIVSHQSNPTIQPNNALLEVKTGDGDDIAEILENEINARFGNASLEVGSGDGEDMVTVEFNIVTAGASPELNGHSIDTLSDSIYVGHDGAFSAGYDALIDIQTGEDNDILEVNNNEVSSYNGEATLVATTEDGDDIVNIDGNSVYTESLAFSGETLMQPAESINDFNAGPDTNALMYVDTGNGDDQLNVEENHIVADNGNATLDIETGTGNDSANIRYNTVEAYAGLMIMAIDSSYNSYHENNIDALLTLTDEGGHDIFDLSYNEVFAPSGFASLLIDLNDSNSHQLSMFENAVSSYDDALVDIDTIGSNQENPWDHSVTGDFQSKMEIVDNHINSTNGDAKVRIDINEANNHCFLFNNNSIESGANGDGYFLNGSDSPNNGSTLIEIDITDNANGDDDIYVNDNYLAAYDFAPESTNRLILNVQDNGWDDNVIYIQNNTLFNNVTGDFANQDSYENQNFPLETPFPDRDTLLSAHIVKTNSGDSLIMVTGNTLEHQTMPAENLDVNSDASMALVVSNTYENSAETSDSIQISNNQLTVNPYDVDPMEIAIQVSSESVNHLIQLLKFTQLDDNSESNAIVEIKHNSLEARDAGYVDMEIRYEADINDASVSNEEVHIQNNDIHAFDSVDGANLIVSANVTDTSSEASNMIIEINENILTDDTNSSIIFESLIYSTNSNSKYTVEMNNNEAYGPNVEFYMSVFGEDSSTTGVAALDYLLKGSLVESNNANIEVISGSNQDSIKLLYNDITANYDLYASIDSDGGSDYIKLKGNTFTVEVGVTTLSVSINSGGNDDTIMLLDEDYASETMNMTINSEWGSDTILINDGEFTGAPGEPSSGDTMTIIVDGGSDTTGSNDIDITNNLFQTRDGAYSASLTTDISGGDSNDDINYANNMLDTEGSIEMTITANDGEDDVYFTDNTIDPNQDDGSFMLTINGNDADDDIYFLRNTFNPDERSDFELTININGGSGEDNITLDGNSISAVTAEAITVTGGDGKDTITGQDGASFGVTYVYDGDDADGTGGNYESLFNFNEGDDLIDVVAAGITAANFATRTQQDGSDFKIDLNGDMTMDVWVIGETLEQDDFILAV